MKTKTGVLFIVVLCLPLSCLADGLFFWSVTPFGQGAEPGEVIMHGLGGSQLEPFEVYLYYRPGTEDIRDSLSLDLKFVHCEIVDAEIFNFPITVLSMFSLGNRWDDFGDVSIEGNTIIGLSATSSSNMGGLRLAQIPGSGGFLVDEGYDASAGAFIVGSVTLRAVQTQTEYLSVIAVSEGEPVVPDLQESELTSMDCVLDPPYGGFALSYILPSDSGAAGGSYHCTAPPSNPCDGTVWNRFIPKSNGIFTCATFGSVVTDTELQIYSGNTAGALTLIAANDDVAGTTKSRVSFPVEQGVYYSIRILANPFEYKPTRLAYEFLEGAIAGDLNGDHLISLLDVSPFVAAVVNGDYDPRADINHDGDVDLLDVNPFVALLTGP
jgi:hypothetical protein